MPSERADVTQQGQSPACRSFFAGNARQCGLIPAYGARKLFSAISLPPPGNPKHQLGHGASGIPCHIPKLVLSPLYTSVRGPSFRHGLPESSHKDVNLGAGNLPESSTCASGKLPSLGSGFRHPCRNDGVFGSAGLVYNDEIWCLGFPNYRFIDSKNSPLVLVSFSLPIRNSLAAISSMGWRILRNIQHFCSSSGGTRYSSRRVPERLMLMAG